MSTEEEREYIFILLASPRIAAILRNLEMYKFYLENRPVDIHYLETYNELIRLAAPIDDSLFIIAKKDISILKYIYRTGTVINLMNIYTHVSRLQMARVLIKALQVTGISP